MKLPDKTTTAVIGPSGSGKTTLCSLFPIIKNADKILVLDQGRIVESGSHEEVAEAGEKYADMWKASQTLK